MWFYSSQCELSQTQNKTTSKIGNQLERIYAAEIVRRSRIQSQSTSLFLLSPFAALDKDFQLMLFILLSDSKNYQNQTIFIKYLRWRYIMNSNTIFVSARIKTFAQSCEGTMRDKIPNTKHTAHNKLSSARQAKQHRPSKFHGRRVFTNENESIYILGPVAWLMCRIEDAFVHKFYEQTNGSCCILYTFDLVIWCASLFHFPLYIRFVLAQNDR